MKKNALRRAVDYLIESDRITKDIDISRDLQMNKGAISTYLSGASKPSKPFVNKFEEFYGIRIADFEEVATKEKSPEGDFQGKYIGVLEQLLNQDLKEVKSRIEGLEQRLDKLLSSYARAEARQIGAWKMIQFLVEEVSAISKDEKNRAKSVAEVRKRLSEHLAESNPAGK